jgi:hypothetical protein
VPAKELEGAVEALRTIALFNARDSQATGLPSAEARIAREWLEANGLHDLRGAVGVARADSETRGIDDAGREVLAEMRRVARARAVVDAREAELVKRGLVLGVPVTYMSTALGLAETTLGMRLKARARTSGRSDG